MATAAGTRTPAQTFALAFGVVYLLIGILGFAFTGFDNFASASDDQLIVFGINPLHNLVHIAVGAAFLAGSRAHDTAKTVNVAIGATYLLVAILGFLGVVVDELINNDMADNFLHLVSALLALYFGTAGAEGGVRTATT